MKVLCPQCERLSELSVFRLEGGALVVTCTRCGVEERIAVGTSPLSAAAAAPVTPRPSAPRPQLVSSPSASNVVMMQDASATAIERARRDSTLPEAFDVPPELCPKCIARRAEGPSCAQCGLVYAQLKALHVAPSVWLAETFRALLGNWSDETAHEKARTRALERDELAGLGRLYRLRLAMMPEDPWAQRGRDEVVRLVTTPVAMRQVEAPAQEPQTGRLVYAVIFGVMLLGGGAALLVHLLQAPG